ncbi:MAG: cupredoxin domain-containing protein, partial [Acidimicrobiia bacterium]|nr:cupredoxin domain-containing protein [Acidimicrobiia bacterium]
IEVRLGDEVTINFTNRHGWSQDPDDEFYTSFDQSFRIYETGGSVGDVLWGADTGLVAPGETASVTFTPDRVGEYRYTSVGLVRSGMWGAFVVLDNP